MGIWSAIQASEILGCARRSSCKRGRGDIGFSGHAGGRREHPMGADEVAAVPDAFARQPNGLVVIAPDELRIGGDAAKHGGKRITRAQPQRAARGSTALFPAPGIAQHQAIIALRQREVRIEPKRDLQFGQRILEASSEQIGRTQCVMRPGIFAVGQDRSLRRTLGQRHHRRIRPTHVCAEGLAGGKHAERLAVIRINGNRLLEQRLRNQPVLARHAPEMCERTHHQIPRVHAVRRLAP